MESLPELVRSAGGENKREDAAEPESSVQRTALELLHLSGPFPRVLRPLPGGQKTAHRGLYENLDECHVDVNTMVLREQVIWGLEVLEMQGLSAYTAT